MNTKEFRLLLDQLQGLWDDVYEVCSKSKCTEALAARGIFFFSFWLHCRVAWFLPSTKKPVRGQYIENCRCDNRFRKISIQSSANCQICGVIRYLIWKGETPVEVCNEVKTAYGDKAMNCTSVFKWWGEFKKLYVCAWWSEEWKTLNCDWWNCG